MSFRAMWGGRSRRVRSHGLAGFALCWLCAANGVGCAGDGSEQAEAAFCAPGERRVDDAGFASDDVCDCTVPGRAACIVGTHPTAWSCASSGQWQEVPEGACAYATSGCSEPLASLEICFATHRTCVVRINGSVCGYP